MDMASMKKEMQDMCDMMMKMHEKMEGMISKMPGGKLEDKMAKHKKMEDM